ncbi:MAG: lycopene cyclase domain-containing protein [Anaerolineae bacterium]
MPGYLSFLILFLWLPLVLLWIPKYELFLRYKKTFLLVILVTFLFGLPWDLLAVISGLWRYDSSPTLGIWLTPYLPLEGYLFILTFPILMTSFTLWLRDYLRS